jgi:hypothetical protein
MSETSSQNNNIERFVRCELGCTCPDEVFANIRLLDSADILQSAHQVYDIGGRLLVVVLLPENWHEIQAEFGRLVDSARKYRDRHDYHRLRLVIATSDNKAAKNLQKKFDSLSNTDEKIHLHVIEPAVLPSNVSGNPE